MADFGMRPDIALGLKPSPQLSLPDLLNLARGAQAYQQSQQMNPLELERQQQATRTGQINLEVAEQADIERKNLMGFFKNPDNFQTNGKIDLDKINSAVPQIAPLTGQEAINRFTALSAAQTSADKSKQDLTTNQRELVSSRLGVLGRMGITNRTAYEKELDLLAEQYPNNSSLKSLVNAYKEQLKFTQEKDESLPQIAIRESQSLLTPTQQESTFAPKVGLQSTGGGLQPITTTPSIGGKAPTIEATGRAIPFTMAPGTTEVPTGKVDQNNQPTAFRYDAQGRLLGEFPIGIAGGRAPAAARPSMSGAQAQMAGEMPLRRIPADESPETYRQFQLERGQANEIARTVPNQIFNSNEIIKLADAATTGRGAELLSNLTGGYAAIPFSGDMATNLQQLGHYMSLQTQALSQAGGLNTDAARALAAESAGTINWTPEAIKSTARVNRALSLGTQLYNAGMENAIAKNNGDVFAVRKFKNDWTNTMDIKALKLYDAYKNRDTEGMAQVVRSLGGVESAEYKKAKKKIDQLNALAGQ